MTFVQLESPTQIWAVPAVPAGTAVVSLISSAMSGLEAAEAHSHSALPKTPVGIWVDGMAGRCRWAHAGTARPMVPVIMPLQLPVARGHCACAASGRPRTQQDDGDDSGPWRPSGARRMPRVNFRRLACGGGRGGVIASRVGRGSVKVSITVRGRRRRVKVRPRRRQAARASARGGAWSDGLREAIEVAGRDRGRAEARRVVQLDQLGEGGGAAGSSAAWSARGQLAAGLAGAAREAALLQRLERARRRRAAPRRRARMRTDGARRRRHARSKPQAGERRGRAPPSWRACLRAALLEGDALACRAAAQRPTERAKSTCLPRSYSMTYLNQASSTLSSIWRSAFHAALRRDRAGPGGVGSKVTQPGAVDPGLDPGVRVALAHRQVVAVAVPLAAEKPLTERVGTPDGAQHDRHGRGEVLAVAGLLHEQEVLERLVALVALQVERVLVASAGSRSTASAFCHGPRFCAVRLQRQLARCAAADRRARRCTAPDPSSMSTSSAVRQHARRPADRSSDQTV